MLNEPLRSSTSATFGRSAGGTANGAAWGVFDNEVSRCGAATCADVDAGTARAATCCAVAEGGICLQPAEKPASARRILEAVRFKNIRSWIRRKYYRSLYGRSLVPFAP